MGKHLRSSNIQYKENNRSIVIRSSSYNEYVFWPTEWLICDICIDLVCRLNKRFTSWQRDIREVEFHSSKAVSELSECLKMPRCMEGNCEKHWQCSSKKEGLKNGHVAGESLYKWMMAKWNLHEIIDENCLLTLWQIDDELRRRLPHFKLQKSTTGQWHEL